MFNQQAVFDDENIGSNPVHGLETRKSPMDDYKVPVSHNNALLVFQPGRGPCWFAESCFAFRSSTSMVAFSFFLSGSELGLKERLPRFLIEWVSEFAIAVFPLPYEVCHRKPFVCL